MGEVLAQDTQLVRKISGEFPSAFFPEPLLSRFASMNESLPGDDVIVLSPKFARQLRSARPARQALLGYGFARLAFA